LVNGSVLPWLLVTATNVGLNTARGTRRYRDLLARLRRGFEVADAPAFVVDSELGVSEQLRAALRALGDVDRRLVALVVLHGYPVADAAILLGLTPSAAESRLHRARAQIRERLGETGTNRDRLTGLDHHLNGRSLELRTQLLALLGHELISPVERNCPRSLLHPSS
jgi:DNA-directed RNA polymerase specialized sigma24 family protein